MEKIYFITILFYLTLISFVCLLVLNAAMNESIHTIRNGFAVYKINRIAFIMFLK